MKEGQEVHVRFIKKNGRFNIGDEVYGKVIKIRAMRNGAVLAFINGIHEFGQENGRFKIQRENMSIPVSKYIEELPTKTKD